MGVLFSINAAGALAHLHVAATLSPIDLEAIGLPVMKDCPLFRYLDENGYIKR